MHWALGQYAMSSAAVRKIVSYHMAHEGQAEANSQLQASDGMGHAISWISVVHLP
jgi:hypothetical protein